MNSNARSGQASWYVSTSEQNVLLHKDIDDLVDDLDKKERMF